MMCLYICQNIFHMLLFFNVYYPIFGLYLYFLWKKQALLKSVGKYHAVKHFVYQEPTTDLSNESIEWFLYDVGFHCQEYSSRLSFLLY